MTARREPGRAGVRRAAVDELDRTRMREARTAAGVLDAVGAVLGGLRDVRDPHALERRFCRDVAAAWPGARVMLSRVEQDAWRPWVVAASGGPEPDRHFAAHLRGARVPFAVSVAEERARRTLEPALFDPARDGAAPPPLRGRAEAYVVVPLVGSTGVFGLVHADRHDGGPVLGEEDRAALWLLVDGLAHLHERAVAGERLRAQHARLRQALSDLDAETAAVVGADVGLDRDPLPGGPPAAAPSGAGVLADARLTPRERDVAELVAQGLGNAAIARELVIVPGTVKTHVKAIMRKLGAASRAEAIAIILGHRTRG